MTGVQRVPTPPQHVRNKRITEIKAGWSEQIRQRRLGYGKRASNNLRIIKVIGDKHWNNENIDY